jgi:hypothetical protein
MDESDGPWREIPVHQNLPEYLLSLQFSLVLRYCCCNLVPILLEHNKNMYGYHGVGSLPLYRRIERY